MFNTKEKKERSLGVKLFLKPYRCNSPKCVTVRRAKRPGLHGEAYRRAASEFGQQLLEKQRIRFTYGLRERQFRKLFSAAAKNPGVTGRMLVSFLERRLDNVVFRLGLAPSRSVARQLVGHGHIMVNGRRVDVPSYQVKVGNMVSVRPQSKEHPAFKDLANLLKKYDAPVWLKIDKDKLEGKVVSEPKDLDMIFNINMVVDFYSK